MAELIYIIKWLSATAQFCQSAQAGCKRIKELKDDFHRLCTRCSEEVNMFKERVECGKLPFDSFAQDKLDKFSRVFGETSAVYNNVLSKSLIKQLIKSEIKYVPKLERAYKRLDEFSKEMVGVWMFAMSGIFPATGGDANAALSLPASEMQDKARGKEVTRCIALAPDTAQLAAQAEATAGAAALPAATAAEGVDPRCEGPRSAAAPGVPTATNASGASAQGNAAVPGSQTPSTILPPWRNAARNAVGNAAAPGSQRPGPYLPPWHNAARNAVGNAGTPGSQMPSTIPPPRPPMTPPPPLLPAPAQLQIGWQRSPCNDYTLESFPHNPSKEVCAHFVSTGTCKYGAQCFKHHPDEYRVPLNLRGFPLRAGKQECPFYIWDASCKNGKACKFHHPNLVPMYAAEMAPGVSKAAEAFAPSAQGSAAAPGMSTATNAFALSAFAFSAPARACGSAPGFGTPATSSTAPPAASGATAQRAALSFCGGCVPASLLGAGFGLATPPGFAIGGKTSATGSAFASTDGALGGLTADRDCFGTLAAA